MTDPTGQALAANERVVEATRAAVEEAVPAYRLELDGAGIVLVTDIAISAYLKAMESGK